MKNEGYLLGLDIGSSYVNTALVDIATGKSVAQAQSPESEMKIDAPQPGWAEQNPELWWEHAKIGIEKCLASIDKKKVKAIGIGYQMHGLVCVDKEMKPLRPSIIWCDSRAVPYGNEAFATLGSEFCLSHYLNSPGNFTVAKLKWVREHEPELFHRIYKVMLPGDYIA